MKPRLLDKYPIKELAVFGSYAQGTPAKESDVDILVTFYDRIGVRFIDLADELETELGVHVDLVSRNGIKPQYLEQIQGDLVYV